MGTVFAARGSGHYPCPGNPQTSQGEAVAGTAAAAVASNSLPSNPTTFAGAIGTLTINTVSRTIDLTQWGARQVVEWINANVPGVVASISPFSNRIQLISSTVQIVISGDAAVLYCLGLSAGTTAV